MMTVQGVASSLQELCGSETASAKTSSAQSAGSSEDKKLRKACKDFESIFLGYMLKSMRKTVEKSELFGSSQEEEIYQGMMDEEICKSAAESNSIGIADTLYSQLSSQINISNNNASRGEDHDTANQQR
ncbi:rod-binding protein [bacterium]|nr:rod-binding protein [bacterium]